MIYGAQRFSIDNPLFWSFGGLTAKLLLFFAAVSAVFQFFGQPIACLGPKNDLLNGYCRKYGQYASRGLPVDELSLSFHWATLYLLQQAFTLYLPRLLWRKLEGNTIERLVLASKSGELLRSFNDSRGAQHRAYCIKFNICQMYTNISAVINVVSFCYIAIDFAYLLPYEITCSYFSQKDMICYILGNIANQLFIIIALYGNEMLCLIGLVHFILQGIFVTSPFVRNAFLHYRFKPLNEEYLKQVVYSESWTALFLVEQLARNLDHEEFDNFIRELATYINTKKNIAP